MSQSQNRVLLDIFALSLLLLRRTDLMRLVPCLLCVCFIILHYWVSGVLLALFVSSGFRMVKLGWATLLRCVVASTMLILLADALASS